MLKNLKHFSVLGICILLTMSAFAGDINPPGAPDVNAMFTLENVYQRLIDGTPGSQHTGFASPLAGPGSTMHSINEIMEKLPAKDDANGANPEHVMIGKTYWGLTAGNWGLKTGTMFTQTLSAASGDVSAGYYSATTLQTIEEDLVSANIKAGVNIFGVDGDSNVVNTSSGDAAAGDILAGKKAYVDGSEITGSIVTQTLSAASGDVSAGFYAATTLQTIDTDLAAGNIRAGVNIFGVDGDSNVVDTSSGDAVAANISVDKKAWVDGSEVTGTLVAGYSIAGGTMSAGGRWCQKGDFVLDTTTGTIWSLEANVPQLHLDIQSSSNDSVYFYNYMNHIGDYGYRVPTYKELLALTSGTEGITSANKGFFEPILIAGDYLSSTAAASEFDLQVYDILAHQGDMLHWSEKANVIFVREMTPAEWSAL